jgi:DNA polymerase-3 subunit epsilon
MGNLSQDIFVCVDCETTGLDPEKDKIIEIAVVRFTFSGILERYETLVNPLRPIPAESQAIHHITDEMVEGQPTINQVLPQVLEIMQNHPIVGHGVPFDIDCIHNAAKNYGLECTLKDSKVIDTLRLARNYGNSPINSLAYLREHFNVPFEGAHRAMSDVLVNVDVFKHLSKGYRKTEELYEILSKPILLKTMPLGKHKGRAMKEIPLPYLQWASKQNFDQDLIYSLRSEIKKRKKQNSFSQASNPFNSL